MNIKSHMLLLFFVLAFVVGVAEASGQTVYEIEGTVYGPDGKAMGNVVITLQNHAGAQVDQDITKSDGRYRFSGVVAGMYYLSIKPAERDVQQQVQKIELINSGVNIGNFSKERFDFSLKRVAGDKTKIGRA